MQIAEDAPTGNGFAPSRGRPAPAAAGGRAGTEGDPGLEAALRAAGTAPPSRWSPPSSPDPGGGTPLVATRALLRLVGVDPRRCPYQERTRFSLTALLVLANAGVAALAVPAGFAAAYAHLAILARVALGILGAAVVGGVDALVVGSYSTLVAARVRPPEEPPPLPGPGRRIAMFVLRLALTAALAIVLGQLLTLAVDRAVVKKQLAAVALADRNRAVAAATASERATIAADTRQLTTAEARLSTDEATQRRDLGLAECERYGGPAVAGCTGRAGAGTFYQADLTRAHTTDQAAIVADETGVGELQSSLAAARQALTALSDPGAAGTSSPATRRLLARIDAAGAAPEGLAASRAALDAYAASHHWSWLDINLMSILVLGVDIVPVGWKLVSGTSGYEAELWLDDYELALWRKRRRQAEAAAAAHHARLAEAVSGEWVATRSRQMAPYLAATAVVPAASGGSPAGAPGAPGAPGGGDRRHEPVDPHRFRP